MKNFKIKKIRQLNLGAKLIESRKEKGFNLEEVYKICKIPVKYLKALEEENWQNLPGEIYLKNFLKQYCKFLELNFKLCFRQYKKQKKIQDNKIKIKKKSLKDYFFSITEFITPQRFKIALIILLSIIFLIYIYLKIDSYLSPPKLIIEYPDKNFETTENLITIKGQTEKETIVLINGDDVPVEENGEFNVSVKLKYGVNRFNIISQRKHSKQNKKEVIILKKTDYIEQNNNEDSLK